MTEGHGHRAEDALEAICHRLFGCDLVLRSPVLVEKSGPKELTDFLVVIDDTAVVLQSKSTSLDISELDHTKLGRIKKKHDHAKRQLNTTLNAHKRRAHVRATTPLNVEFDLDWSWIKQRIGIVTLHVPDERYEDPEFRFQYPYLVEEHNGISVHTFLLRDLEQMTAELTTPGDVLLYLSTRQQCVARGRAIFGNELDFLAFFKTRYPEIQWALSEAGNLLRISPGIWESYRTSQAEQIAERDKRFGNSIVVDHLVRQLRTSVEYSAEQYHLTPQVSSSNYLKLIGKLGKLTRLERATIGDMLRTKVEKTCQAKWGYFLMVSTLADTAYLFLIINEEDREKRKAMLDALCTQACHKVACSDVLGLAMSGPQQQGFSVDALLMNVAEITANSQPDTRAPVFRELAPKTISEWDF